MPALSIVIPFKGQREIDFALLLATANAVRELRANPWIPSLYGGEFRYRRDPKKCSGPDGTCERFLSPLQAVKERIRNKNRLGLDCDDVSPWRAAEYIIGRHTGGKRDRKARAKSIKTAAGYHVIVKRGDGTIEDPSKRLGMGQRKRG